MNSYWLSGDFRPLSIKELSSRTLSCPEVFIKESEESAGGHGVMYFNCAGGEAKLFPLLISSKSNVVVQEGIKQNSSMNALNPTSVNSLRVLTLLTVGGEVKVLL